MSWAAFKAFLNDQHQPEHLWTLSAYHKWCQAQQRVTQSVNSFVAYLDKIEGVVVRTIPPNQVRLIGSTGLDSGLVLVERSVKERVGVSRDSACGLLRTVLHTRRGLY